MILNPATTILSDTLYQAVAKLGISETIENIEQQITECKYPEKGQFTYRVFQYAKTLRKSPQEIAKELVDLLQESEAIDLATVDGGYINFYVSNNKLAELLKSQIDLDTSTVKYTSSTEDDKILVEYSQPNTHKELHIGHARNAVLGDVLCNLFRYVGHTVYAENYHGDEGAHVAKCIWYMDKNNLRPSQNENKGTWLGIIYRDATTAIEQAKATENETVFQAEISEVLKQIEERSGKYYELWRETRQWSLDLFEEAYDWLGAHFDNWACESDVSEESFRIVQEYLDKGVFVKSDGAIGADLSECGLGFCLLLKSDGRGLYATKDIALALHRFEIVQPDQCVYIVDNRQSFHFKQIFATLDVMGFDVSKRCHHLAYEVVETTSGAMSSRKGTIVPFVKLIDEIEEKCRKTIRERHINSVIMDEEVNDRAKKIAVAAIRYGMVRIDPDSKIVFDMDLWLKLEGNTGPYLLYSYVRMQSILEKVTDDIVPNLNIAWDKLESINERRFLAVLSNFNDTAKEAAAKLKPNIFANYMYELARTYSSMYNNSPILSEEELELRIARIELTKLAQIYMATGLQILGIPILNKM